jgi:thioredoxin 1
MASDHVLAFTDTNFQSEVLNSPKPVLVDFWAEWCMPCKMLAPTIDEMAEEFAGKASVGKLDIDANQEVAATLGISAIPTVILFKGGRPVKKFVGLTSKEQLASALVEAGAV